MSAPSEPRLAMLWEPADARVALRERFGFADGSAAAVLVCFIPPPYCLAIHGDPELAIAKAKASQDHQQHGVSISSQILILIFSQYVAYL